MTDPLSRIRDYEQSDVLFLGIGNEVLGDDAAGPYFIKTLEDNKDKHDFNYIDCGTVLENFANKIIELEPKLIVIIDAANFSETPGTLKQIDMDTIANASASTHTMPINVFTAYLQEQMNFAPEFVFIGVQAKQLEFGVPMSSEIVDTVTGFAKKLIIG
ncbi:Hydrogenase maturation protease [Elusimicrobium minutum Pei191]|uniref:Hydrogenase maturation protease n=1 Tax=Elusimicrobium minutum (strain Pei191) TaxID=445932 RepID=B2KDT3_ELUMP|nr:hydrogenase maturation peptidase HycI [Elusimicrobium minutum]ACC98679.1 Hydrogenase maturation protease [Elusimicrobium minutum Pei191]